MKTHVLLLCGVLASIGSCLVAAEESSKNEVAWLKEAQALFASFNKKKLYEEFASAQVASHPFPKLCFYFAYLGHIRWAPAKKKLLYAFMPLIIAYEGGDIPAEERRAVWQKLRSELKVFAVTECDSCGAEVSEARRVRRLLACGHTSCPSCSLTHWDRDGVICGLCETKSLQLSFQELCADALVASRNSGRVLGSDAIRASLVYVAMIRQAGIFQLHDETLIAQLLAVLELCKKEKSWDGRPFSYFGMPLPLATGSSIYVDVELKADGSLVFAPVLETLRIV